jgi:predicted pyridoxine 5'-phosphate oxidase superfamily flavin-nucleotide-binding protein
VNELYHDGARELQDRFDTRRLADRLEQVKVHDTISAEDRAFIERMDMLFLATADAGGRPQCSYKGGDPGFVAVLDEHTVAFPNYDGNGMYLSVGNLRVNPHVGLLFVDFGARRRGGCGSTAPPASSPTTSCSRASPAPSSSSASARSRSSRTARATSTGCSSSSARRSSRARPRRRRSRSGSAPTGPTTPCRRTTPPAVNRVSRSAAGPLRVRAQGIRVPDAG